MTVAVVAVYQHFFATSSASPCGSMANFGFDLRDLSVRLPLAGSSANDTIYSSFFTIGMTSTTRSGSLART